MSGYTYSTNMPVLFEDIFDNKLGCWRGWQSLIDKLQTKKRSTTRIVKTADSAPTHYLNQCSNYVNLTHRNKLQWNLNRNPYIFIQGNASENIVRKMAAILSRPQYVKRAVYDYRPSIWMNRNNNRQCHTVQMTSRKRMNLQPTHGLQISKIAGCACTGNLFPATAS